MGKLGKKARKFAKKNLQSVLRNRRKTKALFKRKARKGGRDSTKEQVEKITVLSSGRSINFERIHDLSLENVFAGNELHHEDGDLSESDGYLSEESSYKDFTEIEGARTNEDEAAASFYSTQNEKIHAKLARQMDKLEKLRKKDSKFSKLLESFCAADKTFQNGYADEDESSGEQDHGEFDHSNHKTRLLTNEIIDTWFRMVKEHTNVAPLSSLLNAYRAACHYGTEAMVYRIENGKTFYNIIFYMLSRGVDLFKCLLHVSSSKSGKEALLDLNRNPTWKTLRPLIKSFVRSTLFLLNQVTDTDILTFIATRIRASLVLFAAFPSQIPPLVKVIVHLWATGDNKLSSASFSIIRDLVAVFDSVNLDTCVSKTFSAFLSLSRAAETVDFTHILCMRDHLVQLCSLDVETSSLKALGSMNQLAMLLAWGEETKKKEAFRKICSWEYVNCLDIWVRFVGENTGDHDIQQLFLAIQIINGMARLFPGPRYFPLRLKSIEWLNYLSRSTGAFIPIVSIVLDIFEYKFAKEGRKAQDPIDISSILKLPKHYLKTKTFQERCFSSAIEQLCAHFSQWSCHISFPDLAAVPLIRLKRTFEITTTENLRRMLKRFIDQVEQNVDFIQRKRDEVSFSPHDHQSVDSFLQLEKPSLNTPFMQYYKSVVKQAF